MKKVCTVLCVICISTGLMAADSQDADSQNQSNKIKHHIEISFGNSVLFLDQGVVDNSQTVKKRTVPVSSYLFIFEWRIFNFLEMTAAWNLPKETVKRVEDGKVSEKYVCPSYGAGIMYIPYTFTIFGSSYLEPQFGLSVFRTYKSISRKGDYNFPLSVFRISLAAASNTSIYAGISQAPAKDTTAFIFGIGQRF